MKIHSLEEMFLEALRYAYDAEKQLTEALPKMIKASTTPQLREAFEAHLQETQEHVTRAEQVFKLFGQKAETRDNTVLKAMTHEAEGMMNMIDASPLRDCALILAANQVEHYEMAAYGSLKIYAELLGNKDAVRILNQTLNEEKKADAKVTEVGETYVNRHAAAQHVTAGAH